MACMKSTMGKPRPSFYADPNQGYRYEPPQRSYEVLPERDNIYVEPYVRTVGYKYQPPQRDAYRQPQAFQERRSDYAAQEARDIAQHGIKVQVDGKSTGEVTALMKQMQAGNLAALAELAAKLDQLAPAEQAAVEEKIDSLPIPATAKGNGLTEWYNRSNILTSEGKADTTVLVFAQKNLLDGLSKKSPFIGISGKPVSWKTVKQNLRDGDILHLDSRQVMSAKAARAAGYEGDVESLF